jgi:hypothetical protein
MRLGGINAAMTIEEATDADIFLAYVEHVLTTTSPIASVGHSSGQITGYSNLSFLGSRFWEAPDNLLQDHG